MNTIADRLRLSRPEPGRDYVYFVNAFARIRESVDAAPWFVISGTGNYDHPRNHLDYQVVKAEEVFKTIDEFEWIDAPYVVTGYPFETKEAADAKYEQLMDKQRTAWVEEMLESQQWEAELRALEELHAPYDDDDYDD